MNRGIFFRRGFIVLLGVIFLLSAASIAHAEIKTYKGVGDYIQSEDDPPKEIKKKAKLYAERNALENAGVFIKSQSKTRNFELVDDEIISVTGSILKIIDTTFEIIPLNDKTGVAKYRATVIAEIDTDKIDAAFDKWLGRDKKERSALAKQNEELQKTIDEQNRRIAALEQTVLNAKTDADNQKVLEDIKIIDKETLYAQKLDEAQKLSDEKKYEDAIKVYTEVIEIKPDSAEAYYNRARHYNLLDQEEKSMQDLNKAIELNYADAYNYRGWIYHDMKNYGTAIRDISKAIEIEPNNFEFYESRGIAYYFDIKNYDAAIKDLSKAIELNPKSDSSYYMRASIYHDLENYDEAVCDYVNAIEIDPDDENYYVGLGLVVGSAKSDKSVDALTKFIKIKHNHELKGYYSDKVYNEATGYSYRARVYLHQENYNAAVKDHSKAIELDPKNSWHYDDRAFFYKKIKNYDAAAKDYSKAIELDPKNRIHYKRRAELYKEIKNYEAAIKDYKKAIELDPDIVNHIGNLYDNHLAIYKETKNYDAAVKDYTEMINRYPKNKNPYWYRGWVYIKLQKYDEAIVDYTKVIELNPKDPSAYLNRGVAYESLKNYEQAIKDYTKAIECYEQAFIKYYNMAIKHNPEYGLAYNNRGFCYQQLGDEAKAQADFAKAKELKKEG